MTRLWISGHLAFLLFLHAPLAMAGQTPSHTPTQDSIQAEFVSFDAEAARVTYILSSGQTRTSDVSSPAAQVKLARLRPGQKVMLKCGPVQVSGQCTVEDVKKKKNWLKRGLIIAATIITIGLLVDSMGTL